VTVAEGLEQQAAFWFARHDGRAGVAAGPQAGACVEGEAAAELLFLVGGVARVALGDEDRADLLLEEGDALGRGGVIGWSRGRFVVADWGLAAGHDVSELAELGEAEEAVAIGVEVGEEFFDGLGVVLEPGGVAEQTAELGAREFAVLVGVAEAEQPIEVG